jgi:hypothetical protein
VTPVTLGKKRGPRFAAERHSGLFDFVFVFVRFRRRGLNRHSPPVQRPVTRHSPSIREFNQVSRSLTPLCDVER